MPVTIAYEIGIRSLPLPKFFSLFKCLKLKRVSSYFAFPRTILGLIYISLLDARLSGTCLLMSACCNSCTQKQFTISGRTFIYKQSVGDLTLAQFLKHAIIPQNGRFPLQVFETSSLEVSEKSRSNRGTQRPFSGKWSEMARYASWSALKAIKMNNSHR